MNVIPEGLTGGSILKRVLVSVIVVVVLIGGSALLVDLGSSERVTVTFEGDTREHVSGFDFEHRTVDARSGTTVVTNSRDGVSRTNRSLRIMFREPKESVAFHVRSPHTDVASVDAFGLDRNLERSSSPNFGILEPGEWRSMSFGGPIHGIEVMATDRNGQPVPVWVDDISFQGPPPPISGGTLLAGLATLWIAGLAVLFVVSGLFGRLRPLFDDGGSEWSGLVIDDVYEEGGDRYVVLRNASDETVDLSEASITDDAGNRFRFAEGFTLTADESETFHVHESFAPDPDSTFTLTARDGEEYEVR